MSFRRFLLFTFLLALAGCLLASRPMFAQSTTTGEISGTVTDPSGAVLPNVELTIKSVEKGYTQSTHTNSSGGYRFPLLAPGNYTISSTSSGFKTVTLNQAVSVGAVAITNIKMEVGATGTTVEVSGVAPLLQTDSSEISTTMNTLAVQTLPNPGNDLSFIAQTAPGSTMNTQSGYGNFSSFGISATSNLFTINGMYDNDPFLNLNNSGATNLLLGNNEVQEATVVSNGYSGQYGGFAGAQVNYVTKSGSNQWHGNAAYWWNGSAMNANDWFHDNTTPLTPKTFVNANQWAASFGGPIVKDKAFFFFNYEGLRVLVPVSQTVTQPTAAFQAATLANLTGIGQGAQITAPGGYNQMFGLWNNAPGTSRATAVPLGGTTNGGCGDLTGTTAATGGVFGTTVPCAQTFIAADSALTHEYLLAGRFDFNLTNNDKFFFRAQEDKGLQATYTDPITPLFNSTSNQPEYQSQASWTHTFGTKAVNNLVPSVTYYSAIFNTTNRAASLAAYPTNLLLGDESFNNSSTGLALGGENFAFPQGRNVTQYQFVDDFSYNLNSKNTLKLGENFHRYLIGDHDFGNRAIGLLIPLDITNFYNGGTAGEGAVLQQNFATSSAVPVAIYGLGWYVQDEWRALPSLKLTFTMRFDHNSNPVCQTNCFARLDTNFFALDHTSTIPYNQAIVTGQSSALQSFTAVMYQPRFGFAWNPTGLKNTVFRGGIGLFADTFPGQVSDLLATNPPGFNSFSIFNFSPISQVPGSLFTQTAAANTAFNAGFSSGEAFPTIGPLNVNSANNIQDPMYAEWNFEMQQGIGNNTTLSLNYVGNHGYHETVQNNNINAFAGGFAGLPATAPDPRFGVVNQVFTNAVSNYNGLTASLQHRFSHGLQLQGNFTWSHALDEISNGGFNPFNFGTNESIFNPVNPYNIRSMYGNADYDTRKYASISYVYQMPYWGGPKPLTNGWQLSGTLFARSGLPYTVTDAGSSSALSAQGYGGVLFGGYNGAPQGSCGKGAASATNGGESTPCLNAADFSPIVSGSSATTNAPINSFGTQRRNQFFGPGYFDTDFTVMKYTSIPHWEQGKIGLGVQFFNLFNHPNFDQPVRDISNAAGQFGQITRTVNTPTSILGSFLGGDASPRLIQLTAKFNF